MSVRPFFPYYGSKWNIARHYPAPQRRIVIEPFAGSAGYSLFYACPRAVLIDIDPIVAGTWNYLFKVTKQEIERLPDLPNVGDCVDDYKIPEEAKWLIGFWLNRGSAQPKKSRTAYSARIDRAQLNWSPRAKQRIASQLDAIRGWRIIHGSYDDAPDVEATWFIDPPYGDKGKYYRKQFSEFDKLAYFAQGLQGQVICCGGEGCDWMPFEPLGNFKSSNGRAKELIHAR
jgi:site-specific DNA-adenine methylase